MKKFFVNESGELKWLPILFWFSLLTAVGCFFLGNEIVYNLSHRFFRSGIFHILGPVIGVYLFYKADKKYKVSQEAGSAMKSVLLGALIFWVGLFIPATVLKADRSSNIPDVSIYYSNGKVINTTDASKEDYYFKHVKVSAEDSLYILTYGEEPGYNVNRSDVRSGDAEKSVAPRANDEWTRPNLVEHVDNY